MAYAYLTVRIPIAEHSFVQTPQNAKGLLEQIFRRDPRTMGCVVEVDQTTCDRELEAEAWAKASSHVTAEEHAAWIEAGHPGADDVIDDEYSSGRASHNIFERNAKETK